MRKHKGLGIAGLVLSGALAFGTSGCDTPGQKIIFKSDNISLIQERRSGEPNPYILEIRSASGEALHLEMYGVPRLTITDSEGIVRYDNN